MANMNLIILHDLDYSRNIMCPIIPCIQPLKEKEDPVVCSINRKEEDHLNKKL